MLSNIILLLFILIFIISTNKYETFVSLEKLVLDLKNPKITKENILNESKQLRGNSNISLSNKNADDKLITEFIAKQLGKEEVNTPDSYDTNTDMLKYPKAKKEEPKQVPSKNINYDDKIEAQQREIKSRREQQDITLRNIKYELMKLNEYRKPIFNLKNEYKRIQ